MSATPNTLPKAITVETAKSQFGQILRRASGKKPERFVVKRRGEPAVVILGIEDFVRTIAPEQEVLTAVRAESRAKGTDSITTREIDREIAAARKERKVKRGASKRRS